jgi:hypothetical protein
MWIGTVLILVRVRTRLSVDATDPDSNLNKAKLVMDKL